MEHTLAYPEAEHTPDMENPMPETFTHETLAEIAAVYRESYSELLYKARGFKVNDPEATVQTTFEKALKSWNKYEDRGYSRTTWLRRILANTAITELRHTKLCDEEPSSDLYAFSNYHDSGAKVAFDELETDDNLARIKDILADKPEHWYQIIEMLTLGYTNTDISEILNIKVSTIQTSLFRVRKLFRENADLRTAISHN